MAVGANASRLLATSFAQVFEVFFSSVTAVVPDQIGLIWLRLREEVLLPAVKVAVVLCLIMSVMLVVEKLSMGLVSLYVKVFDRTPEKIYKWEPIREDVELGNLAYPMVLVQVPMFNEKEAPGHQQAPARGDHPTNNLKFFEFGYPKYPHCHFNPPKNCRIRSNKGFKIQTLLLSGDGSKEEARRKRFDGGKVIYDDSKEEARRRRFDNDGIVFDDSSNDDVFSLQRCLLLDAFLAGDCIYLIYEFTAGSNLSDYLCNPKNPSLRIM